MIRIPRLKRRLVGERTALTVCQAMSRRPSAAAFDRQEGRGRRCHAEDNNAYVCSICRHATCSDDRQAEVGAAKAMIERTEARFGLKHERLAADTAYGSAANLHWIVNEKGIAPHIPVIDKSKREDGTFSREDFTFDKARDIYTCPAGKVLSTTGRIVNVEQLLYRASKLNCDVCPLKMRCCPKEPARKIPRSIHENARDVARALMDTEAFDQSCRDRKRVEMLFAHLKRILKLGRLRLRGPRGAQAEFTLAAIAQNLRRLARFVARPPPQAMACIA